MHTSVYASLYSADSFPAARSDIPLLRPHPGPSGSSQQSRPVGAQCLSACASPSVAAKHTSHGDASLPTLAAVRLGHFLFRFAWGQHRWHRTAASPCRTARLPGSKRGNRPHVFRDRACSQELSVAHFSTECLASCMLISRNRLLEMMYLQGMNPPSLVTFLIY